ncbi:hypothetical protein RO3G_17106 [Rhizopus delemar RA 99-880]|uniref:Uncharacterized protein n=1 Tax=Rhizopus delemar (strain RA 99-880 / ATCC MYA-4621 / FGSC 9543 / NRRL 43880) TaxID=246409 RepID=I1CVM8_RHIO9|nr:hypothetical protein RO3G_17106 [Rhizopus delemar RA 99-880]|eukprot:EIE92508.1 hypothetical protein RO3G_17106 [Rhizopus delemar RA 99-880]
MIARATPLFFFFCFSNTTTTETVDLNRFTQLLSNHLLYEHIDKAYSQLSRKISLQFRNAIHVKVKKVPNSQKIIVPVDVQILKRQLKGAVGSFIEDKLPSMLTTRHDINNLQNQLDGLIYEYCSHSISQNAAISQLCLLENQNKLLSRMHEYMNQQVRDILQQVNEFDLPRLFEKTRAQMSGILIHFNQHTMDPLHHKLELKQKYSNDHYWITNDMIQEFISILNHAEEEENNIQHFIDLSK